MRSENRKSQFNLPESVRSLLLEIGAFLECDKFIANVVEHVIDLLKIRMSQVPRI